MIITKTPYRISFFGGGSDYPAWYRKNGGRVLSTTIDKHIYITCRFLPKFFSHNYRVVWSKIEKVKRIENIKHPAVKGLLKFLKIKRGLEIHYDGDLPAKSGMGSSSCFSVGLFKAIHSLQNKHLNDYELAKQTILFEQNYMKETVGSQDQIAAAIGGFNKIKFNKNGSFEIKKIPNKNLKILNKNLLLLYSGIQRKAHNIANSYVKNLSVKYKKNIFKLMEYVDIGEKLLINRQINDFGKLLHQAWMEKKGLGSKITNSKIDELYSFALQNGAYGGKLLGAGGGGFLLIYIQKKYQKKFLSRLKNIINIPFNFSNQGSKIIFNQERL